MRDIVAKDLIGNKGELALITDRSRTDEAEPFVNLSDRFCNTNDL